MIILRHQAESFSGQFAVLHNSGSLANLVTVDVSYRVNLCLWANLPAVKTAKRVSD